jgi:hypothetical protein
MTDQAMPAKVRLTDGLGAALPTGTVVEILPTRIWIESDMMGARHVVMHHQDYGEPFTYASFHYDYAYTSNAGTWGAANNLALALGATEPVEQRSRDFHFPTADELRETLTTVSDALDYLHGMTPQQAADVRKDAMLYRWLRDTTHPDNMRKLFNGCPLLTPAVGAA